MTRTNETRQVLVRAQEKWIGVDCELSGLHQHLGTLELGSHVEEVVLTYCLSLGFAPALDIFEADYAPTVLAALAKAGCNAEKCEEYLQQIKVELLTDSKKILQFSGKSSLRRWLWVIAIRHAGRHGKRESRERPADDSVIQKLAILSGDPQLQFMRTTYQKQFNVAFKDAVLKLNEGERLLLRLHFVESLAIDDIGAALGIHRSTAARRLIRARESLVGLARKEFAGVVQLDGSELESLFRMLGSQIHLSVRSALA